MRLESILDLDKKYVAQTYERQPIVLSEGSGIKVKDIEGNEYLDFVAGIATCALGHSHPAVTETISKQAKKLVHVSNLFYNRPQVELAKALAGVTPDSIKKFFFCNSGAEAVEAAFKLAVKHAGRSHIIALEGSFHGRTLATLGATWKKSYREPFKALIPPAFKFVPFDDLDGIKSVINDRTAAVIAEPIQGEGGINVPSENFLSGLRDICDDFKTLLIFDEIQSGMGRTGKWFASEHWNVEPDIMTMAKALGNGFPIGCMGAKSEVMDSFSPGDHASTFGGNPLACTAGKAVVETMKKERLPQHAEEIGRYFKKKLKELAKKHKSVQEVRGRGLMLALELVDEKSARLSVTKAREEGILINRTAKNVLRFVPPLIIEQKHVNQLIKTLDQILKVTS
ncbi:acetylornithine aminotransferase [candidate division MSBL1 archaeon SCGC-AAA385D11]|uniref:Acetylornithine aminotransferase n=1 Tax=candidate division MSBL1 archaeon SCGC-AAA385D11 TaxID=1698286 RepID=A0A133VNZ0_9EURY|nr:acetylornithine aminotransferase [candidate division MSBL1 archaeon SCGC-AAA385D11]